MSAYDDEIRRVGKQIRALALKRADAAEEFGRESGAFAVADAEYKLALDALANLTAEQFQSRRALRRAV